ncbi:polysaccharide biosynthesis protein [Campylobacter pinnipediorum subsp. caledonicus]|uniref:MATE family efflux transporter n=1 Tax=Campylobacter pinnipediorum TaxID=1965231 RepID=UPI000994C604|nr:MATE family efflux transporter [Campylobacter pinnipediorum]OPA72201.1 polysaccharide biosynthesis protein [Campylobacter pinnipediorum subsp. caledonicus]
MILNLSSSIIVFLVSFGINFFLTPYIVQSLGNEAYGFIGLCNAIISYAYVITLSINSVSSRFVAYEWHKNNFEKSNTYYSSVLIVNIFFSLIVAISAIFFILNINYFLNIPQHLLYDVKLTFIFYFINFCVLLFNGVLSVCAFVTDKLYIISIRNAISSILFACVIYLLFYLLKPMISYLAICALISSVFVFCATFFVSKKIAPDLNFSLFKFDFLSIKELFYSGIWSSFSALNRVLLNGTDLFICNVFLNSNLVGILAISKVAPLILESFVAQISAIFSPKFIKFYSAKKIKRLIFEIRFAMKIVAFIAGVPIAIFIVFAKDFYTLWLSFKSIDEISFIYQISMIAVVPIILISYLFPLLNIDNTTNQLKRPAIVNIVFGISTIFTQILLLKFTDYGLIGVVCVLCVFYSLRILFFDLLNGALNLNLKLYTFYIIYIKHIFTFFILLVFYFCISKFIDIKDWFDFVFNIFFIVLLGYFINLFLLFSKKERKKMFLQIKSKVKRA